MDILHSYEVEPKSRDYVLPGLLPGKLGSIVSPGGVGKSMLSLLFAHMVGGGVDLLGLGEYHTGRVAYLSAEDDQDILHERLHSIGTRLNQAQREACAKGMIIEDLTRHTPDLLNGSKAQAWRDAVERLATGTRLLILDTLRSFHSGDENSGTEMAVLIGHIRAMAARTGCSIVFLHHSSKAMAINGQGDSQQAARGQAC
jgi:RecA-family ATPase